MNIMKRTQDWQIKFEAFIASRRTTPFAWGTNDCAIFAADCILAMTDVDCAAKLRKHRTELQAARVLKRHGGLIAVATAAMGAPVPSAFAQVGDMVLAHSGGRELLAVCNGTSALAPSARGLVSVEMGNLCWRVD